MQSRKNIDKITNGVKGKNTIISFVFLLSFHRRRTRVPDASDADKPIATIS